MIELDEVSRKALVTAKLLFNQGLLFAHRGSITDSILGVITLDLATETVLGAAITALSGGNQKQEASFPAKVTQLEKLLDETFPNKSQILRVHELRNDAQHRAKYPTADELNECRVYTKLFLTNFVSQVWNETFEQVKLSALIKNEHVRNLMAQAEDAMTVDEHIEATRLAATAFETAVAHTERHLVGEFPRGIGMVRVPQLLSREISSSDWNQSLRTLEQIRATVLALSLKISPLDLARYQDLAGHPHLMLSGNIDTNSTINDISPANAEWVLRMCTDAILRIEETVGDLNSPLGQDYWY